METIVLPWSLQTLFKSYTHTHKLNGLFVQPCKAYVMWKLYSMNVEIKFHLCMLCAVNEQNLLNEMQLRTWCVRNVVRCNLLVFCTFEPILEFGLAKIHCFCNHFGCYFDIQSSMCVKGCHFVTIHKYVCSHSLQNLSSMNGIIFSAWEENDFVEYG